MPVESASEERDLFQYLAKDFGLFSRSTFSMQKINNNPKQTTFEKVAPTSSDLSACASDVIRFLLASKLHTAKPLSQVVIKNIYTCDLSSRDYRNQRVRNKGGPVRTE